MDAVLRRGFEPSAPPEEPVIIGFKLKLSVSREWRKGKGRNYTKILI